VGRDARRNGLLDRIVMVVDADDDARGALSDFLRARGYLAFSESTIWRALAYLDMGLRPCAIVLNVSEDEAMVFRSRQVANAAVRGIPVIVGARLGGTPSFAPATGIPTAPDADAMLALVADYCSRRATARRHLWLAARRARPA
jgi:hypothetical protein